MSTSLQDYAASDKNADIVASVSERLINGVAGEFFAANASMFKGNLQFQDFDIAVDFNIPQSPVFTLSPDGKNSLQVQITGVTANFSAISDHSAIAGLKINASVGGTIEVVANRFTFISGAVNITIADGGLAPASGAEGALQKIIQHILDYFLKNEINVRLKAIPLPNPPDFITGFNTMMVGVQILGKNVVALLSVQHDSGVDFTGDSVAANHFDTTYSTPPKLSTSVVQDKAVAAESWNPAGSMAVDFSETANNDNANFDHRVSSLQPVSGADPIGAFDLFVACSNNVFQELATLEIDRKIHDGNHPSADQYTDFDLQISQSKTAILASGLQVTSDLDISADGYKALNISVPVLGSIGHVYVYLKGEGSQQIGIAGHLYTKNQNREIWINPQIDQISQVKVNWTKRITGSGVVGVVVSVVLDGVATLLSWIADILYKSLLALLGLVSLVIQIKLITIPDKLPVSNITLEPQSVTLGNWDNKLYAGFEINADSPK